MNTHPLGKGVIFMFTGIVEAVGTVSDVIRRGEALQLRIVVHGITRGGGPDSAFSGVAVGDSVAVNGVCLTVAGLDGDGGFLVYAMPETLKRTTMPRLRPQDRVNLERALKLDDRLGGHLITGHVDGVGYLEKRESVEEGSLITIKAPASVMRYVVEKGSIAVDGVSLTVASCTEQGFTISVIPHTASVTTLGSKRIGEPCNLEGDIIGKYVEKLLRPYLEQRKAASSSSLTLDFLRALGY
ncbi:MAG: riboflavin synthase [Bacillota bacterium]